ncbi:hypothetical protein [Streptomyces albidoflavus]|uniref:hypothetical protein n=1 Tax=Streptomyces albidoflavus TaxID=1886 RepID=UPI00101E4E58|nr:hypothetical protein [Streptomyces albidoflavus]RZD75783.1 hypothetical protein C0Q60_22720 [Streptomyces albidoflavus]RZD94280.1 hypothetical protein C0Q62_22600 [Streptomyces albidoflavus]
MNRNDRIMNLVMIYAVRHGFLQRDPLPECKSRTLPKAVESIVDRSLLSCDRSGAAELDRQAPPARLPLRAFFATLYYVGLRLEETVNQSWPDVAPTP